jgi:hypothetical protein
MPDLIPRPRLPGLTERLRLAAEDQFAAAAEIDRLRSEVRRLTRELDEARAVLRDAERYLA